QADMYNNVTLWYSFLGGDNESAPILLMDDGKGTYDTDGFLLQHDEAKTVIESDGSAYYNFTFNMTSNFYAFRARYGEFEDDYGLYNVITADETDVRSFFWEPFYTQLEEISMNVTIYNYNITGYGFKYRDVTENYDGEFENVTYSLDSDGDEISLNASFVHSFEKEAKVQVQAFISQYDNTTDSYRFFSENWVNTFTVVDASPIIELEVTEYANYLDNIHLFWNTTVLNDEITAFDIDWGDLSGIESVNISIHNYYHNYSSVGEYEITVTAYANLLSSNLTVNLLIEQITPSGSASIITPEGIILELNSTYTHVIEVETKQLDFILNGSDSGGSNIERIILSTDEGNSVEIFEDGVVTLHFVEPGLRELTITVIDFAGNEFSESVFIFLELKEPPGDFPVPYPFGITTIIGLFSIAILTYLKKKK
ncbi:MAG: hypothetical protein ACTSQF_09265, partial [Candidatus Heimdallarchaeaceae archaeon]